MTQSLRQPINTLTPEIDEINSGTNILNIASSFTEVTVSMELWDVMQVGDLVELILDGNETQSIARQFVKLDGAGETTVDPFKVAKNLLTVGTHTLRYKMTEKSQIDVPNPDDALIGRSMVLSFRVINDPVVADLKLDITSGAAGFSDSFANLLPANIAVVRGKPGARLHAHGKGKVQIYEAFGSDNTVIEIDADGTCPLTLIKVDQLDIGTARAVLPDDTLSITKENSSEVILTKPVLFGEYKIVTGAASSKFLSYSYNNIGIADGRTETIFSVKLNSSLPNERVSVNMADTLGFLAKTRGVDVANRAIITEHLVDIVDNTAEFSVTSMQAGTFTISIATTFDDSEILQEIEFKSLG